VSFPEAPGTPSGPGRSGAKPRPRTASAGGSGRPGGPAAHANHQPNARPARPAPPGALPRPHRLAPQVSAHLVAARRPGAVGVTHHPGARCGSVPAVPRPKQPLLGVVAAPGSRTRPPRTAPALRPRAPSGSYAARGTAPGTSSAGPVPRRRARLRL
jgi:hypothetical protein